LNLSKYIVKLQACLNIPRFHKAIVHCCLLATKAQTIASQSFVRKPYILSASKHQIAMLVLSG